MRIQNEMDNKNVIRKTQKNWQNEDKNSGTGLKKADFIGGGGPWGVGAAQYLYICNMPKYRYLYASTCICDIR